MYFFRHHAHDCQSKRKKKTLVKVMAFKEIVPAGFFFHYIFSFCLQFFSK